MYQQTLQASVLDAFSQYIHTGQGLRPRIHKSATLQCTLPTPKYDLPVGKSWPYRAFRGLQDTE
jgi:hypothetical protein